MPAPATAAAASPTTPGSAASVLVTRPLPSPGAGPLRAAGLHVEQLPADEPPEPDELRAAVTGRSAVLCLLTERIDAAVLDAAGPRLRVVANLAVGHDNIDLAAAADRGVIVTNTPDVLTEATADLTWALLLAAARRVVEGDALVRAPGARSASSGSAPSARPWPAGPAASG
jgi:glyoxylate reductase